MPKFDIEYETIKQQIDEGRAEIIEESYSKSFDEYVTHNYPWVSITGYRIDWQKVKGSHTRLQLDRATDEEIANFFKKTCLSAFKEVCIIYGAHEPGLLVKFDEYLWMNLWKLLPPGFGTKFLVGIKKNNFGHLELIKESFIEIDIDCSEWLTASK